MHAEHAVATMRLFPAASSSQKCYERENETSPPSPRGGATDHSCSDPAVQAFISSSGNGNTTVCVFSPAISNSVAR